MVKYLPSMNKAPPGWVPSFTEQNQSSKGSTMSRSSQAFLAGSVSVTVTTAAGTMALW